MTYATGYSVRLIAGRLVLDFLNTADWSARSEVVHEKLETREDVAVWLAALGLPDAKSPRDIAELHRFRSELRGAIRGTGTLDLRLGRSGDAVSTGAVRALPLLDLLTISAAALLTDPREMARLKTCAAANCGWMFIDETKNGRRRWCAMETCGNRAKAARHYERRRKPVGMAERDAQQ